MFLVGRVDGRAPSGSRRPAVFGRRSRCRKRRGALAQLLDERERWPERIRDHLGAHERQRGAQLPVELGDEQWRRGNSGAVQRGQAAERSVVVWTRVADASVAVSRRLGATHTAPEQRRAHDRADGEDRGGP